MKSENSKVSVGTTHLASFLVFSAFVYIDSNKEKKPYFELVQVGRSQILVKFKLKLSKLLNTKGENLYASIPK